MEFIKYLASNIKEDEKTLANCEIESPITYNIFFDNVDENDITLVTMSINDTEARNFPIPSKVDYEFVGWYYDKEYTRKENSK